MLFLTFQGINTTPDNSRGRKEEVRTRFPVPVDLRYDSNNSVALRKSVYTGIRLRTRAFAELDNAFPGPSRVIKVRPLGIEIASPRRVEDIVGTQKAAISLARIGRDPNEEETW